MPPFWALWFAPPAPVPGDLHKTSALCCWQWWCRAEAARAHGETVAELLVRLKPVMVCYKGVQGPTAHLLSWLSRRIYSPAPVSFQPCVSSDLTSGLCSHLDPRRIKAPLNLPSSSPVSGDGFHRSSPKTSAGSWQILPSSFVDISIFSILCT